MLIAKEFYSNNYIGAFAVFIKGRVFNYYEKADAIPEHLSVSYGLDFGFSHVDSLVKCAVDLQTKRIYVQQLVFQSGQSQGDLSDGIKRFVPYGERIICDSAEPRLISDLRKSTGRLLVPVIKLNVGYQIAQMQDFTIVVVGESPDVEFELQNYRWSDKMVNGFKVPNKSDDVDNAIDSLRYALTIQMKDYEVVGKATSPEPLNVPVKKSRAEIIQEQFQQAIKLKRGSQQ